MSDQLDDCARCGHAWVCHQNNYGPSWCWRYVGGSACPCRQYQAPELAKVLPFEQPAHKA